MRVAGYCRHHCETPALAAARALPFHAAAQWDVVQMTVVLVNILAKSAPYWRALPLPWYLSVAVKAAAFACMLAYPRGCG